jgi:HK97 family phage major capsid protein
MKKVTLKKMPTMNIQLGVRMVGLVAGIFTANLALVVMALFWPIAVPMSFALGLTPAEIEEQRKAHEDLLKQINEQTQNALTKVKNELSQTVTEMKAGLISQKDFDAKFDEITKQLKNIDADKFKSFEETLKKYESKMEEQHKALTEQGIALKKMQDGGAPGGAGAEGVLRTKLREFLNSQAWKDFADSNGKKKVSLEVKAVDMTSSYTGSSRVLITTRSPRIIDHPPITRLNLRDLLNVGPADLPYLAFLEVYDWVRNVGTVSENGMLPESSFKVREALTDVKRIGTFINLSKRMLKSLPFIENYLAQQLPAMVRYAEDFQLLFGDGLGTNPLGLYEQGRDFVTEINATVSGIAGTITSVATYDGGAKSLFTFAANQDIANGDKITFAASPNAAYNSTFSAIVKSPREIVIESPYVAGSTAAVTWTVTSPFKNAIPFAQQMDVIKVAKALVTRREYTATGIIMHPDDASFIEMLKKTDQGYLDVQRFENGVLRISGIPVVETTAMPSGRFAVGDFNLAAALLELTPLQLEFSESTQEKLTNTVVAIIQEEILFPVYNKYMFIFGTFQTAIAAILKP